MIKNPFFVIFIYPAIIGFIGAAIGEAFGFTSLSTPWMLGCIGASYFFSQATPFPLCAPAAAMIAAYATGASFSQIALAVVISFAVNWLSDVFIIFKMTGR